MQDKQPQLLQPIVKIIKGVRWQTEGATVLAFHLNTVLYRVEKFLMRTPSGNYFIQEHIAGRVSEIHPIDRKKAIKTYQEYEVKYLPPEQAFPDIQQA